LTEVISVRFNNKGKAYFFDPSGLTVKPGEKVVLFGNFSYFWIADRGKMSFKRQDELYSNTGQVGFRATKRVDAKLVLPEAIKCLQVKGK